MNLSRLWEAVPCLKVGVGGYGYGHVNFTARANSKRALRNSSSSQSYPSGATRLRRASAA
jgi:hypothetical protein